MISSEHAKNFLKESSPSKYGEGVQGTILEAMSCGLTVIAPKTLINRENIGISCRDYIKSNYD